jgi:hypothetical protein
VADAGPCEGPGVIAAAGAKVGPQPTIRRVMHR